MKKVKVYCNTIVENQELPHCFELGNRMIEVIEIIDDWTSQEYHYYKVRSEDECVYILRQTTPDLSWEITMFDRREFERNNHDDELFHHNFRGKV